ncbi:FAD-dependent oxidoreductase [Nonomuraea fuscirosea]|uniref:FAD-dependent oxidoreductase n=1 Tax=Nonomuraea fuscirosea TaxID=1291556 RepID=UPI0033EF21CF
MTGNADATAVLARRDAWVTGWDDRGQARFLKDIGADLIRGHARLDGPRRVSVELPGGSAVALTARHAVVVCTGSRPNYPELPGLADVRPWTNREATDSPKVPGRLAIIGGGGVGVEMATAWQGPGSSVTLLARSEGLPKMEPFVGEMIARSYAEAGIDVRIGVTVEGLRRQDRTGPVTLSLAGGAELEADEVLLAIGRRPLTGDIGLQTVGLEPGSWLEVDDTCAVRAVAGDRWLYALGDVNGRALLTHQGKYQARVAGAVIAARAPDGRWTPPRGARTPPPPTAVRYRRSSSATRRPARWA